VGWVITTPPEALRGSYSQLRTGRFGGRCVFIVRFCILRGAHGRRNRSFELLLADALRETIGTPRAPLLEATIAQELATPGSTMSQGPSNIRCIRRAAVEIAEATTARFRVCFGRGRWRGQEFERANADLLSIFRRLGSTAR